MAQLGSKQRHPPREERRVARGAKRLERVERFRREIGRDRLLEPSHAHRVQPMRRLLAKLGLQPGQRHVGKLPGKPDAQLRRDTLAQLPAQSTHFLEWQCRHHERHRRARDHRLDGGVAKGGEGDRARGWGGQLED